MDHDDNPLVASAGIVVVDQLPYAEGGGHQADLAIPEAVAMSLKHDNPQQIGDSRTRGGAEHPQLRRVEEWSILKMRNAGSTFLGIHLRPCAFALRKEITHGVRIL
jgi:hypothetical protein